MIYYGFALKEYDTSKEFCDVFKSLFGDGISKYGNQFALSTEGTRLTLDTGFALADGHWLKNDEPFSLDLELASNFEDRYDAVCICVDYPNKKTLFRVLTGIDNDNFDVGMYRNNEMYVIVLYIIRVRRGSTVINTEDINDTRGNTELCGYLEKVREISNGISYAYNLIVSGLDEKVKDILQKYDDLIENAENSIKELEHQIEIRKGEGLGDITISKNYPIPESLWLLCDGAEVPPEYADYREQIGTNTPVFNVKDTRFKAYVYAGNKR